MKVLFVWPNKDSFGVKPIGLSILAGIAREAGWDVKLFDTTEIDFGFVDVTSYGESAKICKPVDLSKYDLVKKKIDLEERFTDSIKAYAPDCVALGVLSDEFVIASRISQITKKLFPEVPVIWGGKYPTLSPEKTLKMYHADFVCIGEGLNAFRLFLNALANGGDLYSIQGIWGKKGEDIIKNSIPPLKPDLDTLPYVNWEMFDKRQFCRPFEGKIYVSGDHMLNWGCPYHCTYCINHIYHKMYNHKYFLRRYGIERIISELKYLKDKYKLTMFKFHDEDFLMRPLQNFGELGKAYKREVGLPFVIETNAKSVNEEKVSILSNMGCVSVSIAIETGDPVLRKELLERVDKEEDIIRAFSLFKKYGIRTSAFNMLGIPFETRETYMKTVDLNRRANVQYPDVGFFYPFDGTKLREIAIKEGFFDEEDEKKAVYIRNAPALHFKDLTEAQLIEMSKTFVLYVKLPKEFHAYIERSEKNDKIGMLLRRRLLEIYEKTVFDNNGWYSDDNKQAEYIAGLQGILSDKVLQ